MTTWALKAAEYRLRMAVIVHFKTARFSVQFYGSTIVRLYHNFMQRAGQGKPTLGMFGELFLAIRRDMGYRDTKLTPNEVLRQFISDYDAAKAKGLV
jgi:hypothetical protein